MVIASPLPRPNLRAIRSALDRRVQQPPLAGGLVMGHGGFIQMTGESASGVATKIHRPCDSAGKRALIKNLNNSL